MCLQFTWDESNSNIRHQFKYQGEYKSDNLCVEKLNSYSAGIDLRHKNLTSIDIRQNLMSNVYPQDTPTEKVKYL